MKQLNVSIEDGLHEAMSNMAKSKGASLTDLTRTILRNLTPAKQAIQVRQLCRPQQVFQVEATIYSISPKSDRFWFGYLHLDEATYRELVAPEPKETEMPNGSMFPRLVLHLPDGKTGVATPFSFKASIDEGYTITFAGCTGV